MNGSNTLRTNFLRSASLLGGCVLLVMLLLVPFAVGRTGSNGIMGLAAAAAICLLASWVAEFLSWSLHQRVTPLASMLLGMAIRMTPPLGICVALAAQRANGRDHLAFISYLLAFYLVTLATDTWLRVRRTGPGIVASHSIAR